MSDVISHGGSRPGAGRKPSPANQKIRVARLQEQLREKFEVGFLKLADKFPDMIELMVEAAVRTEERKVTCALCKHVNTINVPIPDKDMQKYLAGKIFQAQDIDDESDLSTLKRITQEYRNASETLEKAPESVDKETV